MLATAAGSVLYCPTCMRCVTTTAGLRTRHEAVAATVAATASVVQCGLAEPSCATCRVYSYAPKNTAPPGTAPIAAAATPRKRPVMPPARWKPCGACSRVLRESSGKIVTSTVADAKPPANTATANEGRSCISFKVSLPGGGSSLLLLGGASTEPISHPGPALVVELRGELFRRWNSLSPLEISLCGKSSAISPLGLSSAWISACVKREQRGISEGGN